VFQLIYNGVAVKGGIVYKEITIKSPKPAVFFSTTLPVAVQKGWSKVSVVVKLKNNSAEIWKRDKIVLKLKSGAVPVSWLSPGQILRTQQSEVKPGGIASFSFVLNFKNAIKGKNYYQLVLESDGRVLEVEGGKGAVRVD
jgi:hypothetical protein